MNAGELVVSLILNVNRFKAQLQDAQREFDTVQAVAHSAGTGISEASEKSAAAISEISASALVVFLGLLLAFSLAPELFLAGGAE